MMCDNRLVMRLLGFLLALLVALPATQAASHLPEAPSVHTMGHDMHGMTMGHGDHGTPKPGHPVHHDCIGCIAPIDHMVYRPVTTPAPMTFSHDGPPNEAFRLIRSSAPEPPPPRLVV